MHKERRVGDPRIHPGVQTVVRVAMGPKQQLCLHFDTGAYKYTYTYTYTRGKHFQAAGLGWASIKVLTGTVTGPVALVLLC